MCSLQWQTQFSLSHSRSLLVLGCHDNSLPTSVFFFPHPTLLQKALMRAPCYLDGTPLSLLHHSFWWFGCCYCIFNRITENCAPSFSSTDFLAQLGSIYIYKKKQSFSQFLLFIFIKFITDTTSMFIVDWLKTNVNRVLTVFFSMMVQFSMFKSW